MSDSVTVRGFEVGFQFTPTEEDEELMAACHRRARLFQRVSEKLVAELPLTVAEQDYLDWLAAWGENFLDDGG